MMCDLGMQDLAIFLVFRFCFVFLCSCATKSIPRYAVT